MSKSRRTLVICIDNASNPVDLQLRKLYVSLTSATERKHGWVRVIDDSGEDYLFPASMFLPAVLPDDVRRAVMKIASDTDPESDAAISAVEPPRIRPKKVSHSPVRQRSPAGARR